MELSRRAFAGGALSLAVGSQVAVPAFAQPAGAFSAAIAAISAYAEANRRYFGLPELTLGLTAPNGFSTVLNFGHANADARTAIGPDTLFQIGSISKVMTAAAVHQLAAEGKLALDARVSDILPAIPLPRGNAVTVQHLMDHSAGLPDSSPLFAQGGLWTGFAPGAHWHYSNTGYEILGKLAEQAAGEPLASLFEKRIFTPAGMNRSRGAIVARDRTLYAQGYRAADPAVPFALGMP